VYTAARGAARRLVPVRAGTHVESVAVPRILLAEGHAPTREFVTRALSDAGHEVLATDDPQRAWELYAARRPDAVVIGASVAPDDGAALAQRLRGSDPRVVLVAADQEHLGKARGLPALLPLKANAYVADPTRRELVEKLQALLAGAAAAARPRARGVAAVLARPPSATGEVKPGVVARLLHQIWRSLQEGVLVLEEGGAERRVFFLHGVPVACESDVPAESLVAWLAGGGRLAQAAHPAALEAMAGGLSAGAALIAAGVLEPGEPVQATVRAHLKATVVRAVGQKDGRWRFHAGAEFAPDVMAVELLPLQPILEGARAGIAVKHFADALRAVTDAYPVRSGDFQQVLPAAGLGSADLRLALGLDGRITTRAWLESRRNDLKDALSLLWFLSMVGAVAFHEAPEVVDRYGQAPPRRKKPLPADRADAVRQAALQILPGTYFHALGVDIAADAAEVERAYQAVASRFHPDGFAEYDVGDLEDLLAAVQDKATAAYRVLSSEEKRRAYLSFLLLRVELTGARRPGIDVDAEIALKRGERALRARRNAEAVQALRQAVERNSKEPEYAAMLGFAELFDPVLPKAERIAEARRHAKRALSARPDHPRAVAVLALAEELAGDDAEARRIVLAALKAHPGSELLKQVLHRLHRVG
jgi:CheY-like chemotaxis protein/tetratricopeptide (TPR) repeat protein